MPCENCGGDGSRQLSPAEYAAASSSIWYNTYLFSDGRGNLTPEANVAILRGAKFDLRGPAFFRDKIMVDQAMRDIACYLGFHDDVGSRVNDYNSALMTERGQIFFRVPKPTTIVPATSTYPFPVIVQYGEKQTLSGEPAGESEGTIGPAPPETPSIFDTGYYYEGKTTPGSGEPPQGNFEE